MRNCTVLCCVVHSISERKCWNFLVKCNRWKRIFCHHDDGEPTKLPKFWIISNTSEGKICKWYSFLYFFFPEYYFEFLRVSSVNQWNFSFCELKQKKKKVTSNILKTGPSKAINITLKMKTFSCNKNIWKVIYTSQFFPMHLS